MVLNDVGTQRLDDEERIKIVKISAEEVRAMIRDGKIQDAKTLIAWYEMCRRRKIEP
jgi:hypothetical protein